MGLISILLLNSGVTQLRDAHSHSGSGTVRYGDPDGPEWDEEVSEGQYKRHNYVNGGFLLLAGAVCGWGTWILFPDFKSSKKS